jgi:preprotein translocase subunit SecA
VGIVEAVRRKLRYRYVAFDMGPYRRMLSQVDMYDLNGKADAELTQLSAEIARQARAGAPLNDLLPQGYALVREASRRVLGLRPFDVQVMAAMAMHDGSLVEMQTGEGKTLAAVFPAYLNALAGRGVHVLTFNDYLAKRDCEWMGPLYRFLGLSVDYVCEGLSIPDRQAAYRADVTYLTAKEAGFDHLRGFLCDSPADLVQRPFNYAIIDEADSILIDEARIPLVIAGTVAGERPQAERMAEVVRQLAPGVDYATDETERNAFLTDEGLGRVEALLGCGDLHSGANTSLLVDVNNAIHAEALLKRDRDYIVRNGKIELVDEFTGRIADKRHWPYGLQDALEAKEGIAPENKGQIMAQITLQNFIRLYPKICGMTGTAVPASQELFEFYGLNVVVVPTNKPCVRVDYPDVVFTHQEARQRALVSEVVKTHATGRPVLIGTASIEESESLAAALEQAGVSCQILNAKNDEIEAGVIAGAGMLGAVTVSTNMAGRGTDIKLGGEQGIDRGRIVELGGLYLIGTNRHESRRIDDQLRGRAGRQGDPGSSRFFISLEDELLKRYRVKELIPAVLIPPDQDAPIESAVVVSEIARAQRIIETENLEVRKDLRKYTLIMEQQRQIITNWRLEILLGQKPVGLMKDRQPERYKALVERVGSEAIDRAERQAALYHISQCWADYLDYLSYLKETAYLVNLAGKTPLFEYNRMAVEAFGQLLADIEARITATLASAEITRAGLDLEQAGLHTPSSTWTYLINDSPEQLGMIALGGSPVAAIARAPVILLMAFLKGIRQKGDLHRN